MIFFTIEGETPSKKNSRMIVCRGNKPINIPSAHYRDWHEASLWALKSQKAAFAVPVGESVVTITIYPKTKRAADLSNKAESVMDLLVDAGILTDDNWFQVPQLTLLFGGVAKERPRAEIEITPVLSTTPV